MRITFRLRFSSPHKGSSTLHKNDYNNYNKNDYMATVNRTLYRYRESAKLIAYHCRLIVIGVMIEKPHEIVASISLIDNVVGPTSQSNYV